MCLSFIRVDVDPRSRIRGVSEFLYPRTKYFLKTSSKLTSIQISPPHFGKMSKRPAEDTADGNEAFLKRQKISFQTQQQPVEKLKPADEIKSAKQLKQLLTFQQNSGQLRHGTPIAAFRRTLWLTVYSYPILQSLLRQIVGRRQRKWPTNRNP